MKKILSKIIIAVFLLQLGACKWFTGAGTPYFSWSNFKVPDGTPAFQQGYKDGCSTVLYARGNIWYRTRYGYRYDPKMIGNPEYRFGHSRGYTWCFQQVLSGTGGPVGSWDKYIQPYGYDSTFTVPTDGVSKAWGDFFQGGVASPIPSASLNSIFDDLSGGSSGGAFSAHPIWAGHSKGQIFGQ